MVVLALARVDHEDRVRDRTLIMTLTLALTLIVTVTLIVALIAIATLTLTLGIVHNVATLLTDLGESEVMVCHGHDTASIGPQ